MSPQLRYWGPQGRLSNIGWPRACTSFILLCSISGSQETAQPRTIPCCQTVSGVIGGAIASAWQAFPIELLRESQRGNKKVVIHFFFGSCLSFLDEPREETLATQASGVTTRQWVCHLLSTSPPGRFSFALEVGRSVYSERSICRQYAVWSKPKMFFKAMRSTFIVFVSAIEESIKGYATRKLRCGWAAIKGGGRPTRFLPHAKMLLVPIHFFRCWIHYAPEGSTFSLSKCDFSRLFYTKRLWHTYRFTVAFNLWITRSVLRNKLLWALRYANVSLRCRHPSSISRFRTKAPDIKATTVVDRSLSAMCWSFIFHRRHRTIVFMWTLYVWN